MRVEYGRRFADGKRQAAEELRARVASALGIVSRVGTYGRRNGIKVKPYSPPVVHRAPRGSVQPAVLGAIAEL